MGIIEGLMASKWLLTILGAVLGAIYIFYRGYSTGSSVAKGEQKEAEEALNKDVRKAEATNQQLDAQREKDAQVVNATSGIANLIGLWRKLQKAPGSETKKD